MISKLRRSYFSFSVEKDMLFSTYFAFFDEQPGINERPSNERPGVHSDNYGN